MKVLAIGLNEIGMLLQDRGSYRGADFLYRLSCKLAPNWSAPWYNRGLIGKIERRWADSIAFNARATTLSPDNAAAWWNLGIAATAIGDWDHAREAWRHHGVEPPAGEGRPDMDLGPVPIRISPEKYGEVVWCRRLDPARALILSVPLPESGRAYRDIVLHDGEPRGSRLSSGREFPVFNELELLEPGPFQTYLVELCAPSRDDIANLTKAADEESCAADDWSALVMLCTACSEGTPHEHDAAEAAWNPERRVGLGAPNEDAAREVVNRWMKAAPGRDVRRIECVFARHEGGPPA